LQARLNASRHRVKQLEKQIETNNNFAPEAEAEESRLEALVAAKATERVCIENSELKVLLSQRKIELDELQKNFDHASEQICIANIKIAQLSDGSAPTSDSINNQAQIHALSQEIAIRQQQIDELSMIIDQLNRDKEASNCQYQNYVSHLLREMELLKTNASELGGENEELVKREQQLLKHVGDLERQIQQQIQKQKTYAEHTSENVELQKLNSQVMALTEANEALAMSVSHLEIVKLDLSKQLELKDEQLRNMDLQNQELKTHSPNLPQLMFDFQDKSTAASIAMSQNQELRAQLAEMQGAFVNLTNKQIYLVDKLQSETHLCKEMKTLYESMDSELQAMKNQWQFKEDEMIRLSHSNSEQEKLILQQNMEIDSLRHYETTGQHGVGGSDGTHLQRELESSKRMIETLTNKINILESTAIMTNGNHHLHEGHQHHEHSECKDVDSKKYLMDEIAMLKMEKGELLKAMQVFQMKKRQEQAEEDQLDAAAVRGGVINSIHSANEESITATPSIATQEALEKLQERFRRTMLEIADLSDEKQRLEHVVTQLQFETETIGEYITLYQYQRRLLKQKEHERDAQLKSLAADRELMTTKLCQLNSLIENLILQHSSPQVVNATKLLLHEEKADLLKLKQETAGKILEILSDIKTTNVRSYELNESNIGMENCSCCLGKLETV